jgi:hypothetical protein
VIRIDPAKDFHTFLLFSKIASLLALTNLRLLCPGTPSTFTFIPGLIILAALVSSSGRDRHRLLAKRPSTLALFNPGLPFLISPFLVEFPDCPAVGAPGG